MVNHEFNLHTYKGSGDFNHSIISTSNPLKKDGKRPSTIEEARCHLTVSLVIEYSNINHDEALEMLEEIAPLLHQVKVASGDVLNFQQPYLKTIASQQETKQLMAKLMPGFCLIERRELAVDAMEQGLDGMDAVLDALTVNSHCEITEKTDGTEQIKWLQSRAKSGWIVPIAVGFQGITDKAKYTNQRDEATPHEFAESVVTLGEFIMTTHIEDLDNMLWRYAKVENNLYLCQQNQPLINSQEQ